MEKPETAILILNYNGWRDTVECLESVQRLTYPNYRIVVIDNSRNGPNIDLKPINNFRCSPEVAWEAF
ncbi:glycosyltransferase family 2 protein [Candidatus Desulforudis audaxviator]|uniref:Glycosyltransferase 2-like domain-containing protein n=1 Tax=Desulforudis audaxviator (strain MP104C) TaxID=477974 RepID=B1I6V0_DESAP|nr:glycosyltransferase [Candidatus Desulforudis audaxviator]ACA60195.1 hypothetical protein Daud_1696 [Candidatus Desulforudis audaxviator MP104C]AZK60234.1 hypothetical protein Daudx_1691 [Candidatus Desulforudis audaxviator]